MCGIGAVYRTTSGRIPRACIAAMMQKVVHRGPDDSGIAGFSFDGNSWGSTIGNDADLWLGHQRLSIVDLSEHGRQPMRSRVRGCILSFNGELYNYVEIRDELKALGVSFETATDSEVLLEAYEYWGPACLARFKGMFAFVIFDPQNQHLFVARDFFGIKPLYFTENNGVLAFGSECKMLVDQVSSSPRANPGVVHDYLYRGRTDIGQETFFADIKAFPAAHYALVPLSRGGTVEINPVCYWQPGQARFGGTFDEAAERMRSLLFQSVKIHLRSDVPVGANISGGLDSSSILNIAPGFLPDDMPLQLFTYSSDDESKNEDAWVKIANQRTRWPVANVKIRWDSLLSEIDSLIYHQDYPFAGLSMYAENQIYRQASRQGIKVMLGGQGADEYLAGYWPYVAGRLASLLSKGALLQASSLVKGAAQLRGIRPASLCAFTSRYFLPAALQPMFRAILGRPIFPDWMDRSWFSKRGVTDVASQVFTSSEKLREEMIADVTQTSLFHHLRSEDRSSMQYSIESRVPFLEPEMVDFALGLPEEMLIGADGESKRVLRAAMQGVLPEAIRLRHDKIGFETGNKNWIAVLHEEIEQDLQGVSSTLPFLNDKVVHRMLCAPEDHGETIWRIFNLARWSKLFNVSYS